MMKLTWTKNKKVKKIAPFIVSISVFLLCFSEFTNAQKSFEENFITPPNSAKPYTWWHWISGNVSREGITADLEAMKQAGIGGVQCFNTGGPFMMVPEGKVKYASPEWYDLTKFAISECQRLGLEFDIHNCPGWSSTGGRWITPEYAMKQITWTPTYLKGGKQIYLKLPEPEKVLDFYKDAFVLAYPSLKGEMPLQNIITKASADDKTFNPVVLTSEDEETISGKTFVLELDKLTKFQSLSGRVFVNDNAPANGMAAFLGGGGNILKLEGSLDGTTYFNISEVKISTDGVPSTASFKPVTAKFLRITCLKPFTIFWLDISNARQIDDFKSKADYAVNNGFQSAITFENVEAINPDQIIDLTPFVKDDTLIWNAPEGNWTIIRIGYIPINKFQNAAPNEAIGLECDKFSRKAFKFHFDYLLKELIPDLERLGAQGSAGILIDSYEMGMQNWTPLLPQEFELRRGYSIINYLPALTGRYVENKEQTERFLWDFRKTCADLMADNYVGFMAELCDEHGLRSYTEPYNGGPFEQMQYGGKVDISMGEFWVRTGGFQASAKLVSSVARVYQKRDNGFQVVGAEAFTGNAPDARYQTFPNSIKAQGDLMYTKGINRFIFHRYAMQPNPHSDVAPGMTMGFFGINLDRTNGWFDKSGGWMTYMARCQSLLQQGNSVSDIVYLLNEEVPGTDFSHLETPFPFMPLGYSYDLMNRESFLKNAEIRDGKLLFSDGLSYAILALQGVEPYLMSLDVLHKLELFVKQGGILCGTAPVRIPGRTSKAEQAEYDKIINELWGEISTAKKTGKGWVFVSDNLKTVVEKANIKPDFEFTSNNDAPINYIHRQSPEGDIYFVANQRRTQETIVATFRTNGMKPELWNPATGEIKNVNIYDFLEDGRTRFQIQFDESGSWFVVFRKKADETRFVSIEKDGQAIIRTSDFKVRTLGQYADIKNNFSISVWVAPEVESLLPGTSSLMASAEGRNHFISCPIDGNVYGENHSAASLVVTRKGIAVAERNNNKTNYPLLWQHPLSSWNYVTLVYANGVPELFVNGVTVAKGKTTGATVHPGLFESPADANRWFMQGEYSGLELFNKILTTQEISDIYARGIPKPSKPFTVQENSGKLQFFADGAYKLKSADGSEKSLNITGTNVLPLNNEWTVTFPSASGAPEKITMKEIIPLQKSDIAGVKYFSGTATYTTDFTISKKEIKGNLLFLDLGRVAAIAEVTLNGHNLGNLWKTPYMMDISNAIIEGRNSLEVKVTTTWPNRLIGDAQSDDVYEYSIGGITQMMGFNGGPIKKLPDWYLIGEKKPNDGKVAFQAYKFFSKDDLLYDSGLTSPVKIFIAKEVNIEK
ncbi:MAG: hypothetical protein JXB49_05160 [Bacteroidales bacterium]|nr:hypothetical protein [Bacteroidales bacterium]